LLFFTKQSELLKFAENVRCIIDFRQSANIALFLQRGWQIHLMSGTITFQRKGEEQVEIPKQKLIAASLAYARELEQIV